MKVITIAGSHSNVGKTLLAEKLLKVLKGWSAIKVTLLHDGACPTGRDCGACSGLDSEFSIVSDKFVIEEKGKDTARFKAAGARKVLWLKARPAGLKEGLMKALSEFKGARGVIIESTSALKHINPDLAILVTGKDSILKPSARSILKKVDFIYG